MRARLIKWLYEKYIFGYYKKNGNTYKGLPRYREILTNRYYKGNTWREAIKYRWIIR